MTFSADNEIVIPLNKVQLILFRLVATLSALGLIAEIAYDIMVTRDPYGLVGFASLSHEANLPTWAASSLLLLCAVLLLVIGLRTRLERGRFVFHWVLLALIFTYISLDEAVQLHEYTGGGLEGAGALYFQWVIPAAIVVAAVGLFYLPFVLHLPDKTRFRVVAAGVVYVSGALLMELPLGYWVDYAGRDNLVYGLIDWVEETLELTGTAMFLYALLVYLLTTPLQLSVSAGED